MDKLLRKRLLIHAGLLRMKAARARLAADRKRLLLDADALALRVRSRSSSERGVRSPQCGAIDHPAPRSELRAPHSALDAG